MKSNIQHALRDTPHSDVFSGADKCLKVFRHSIKSPTFPIMENDSFYLLVRSGDARVTIDGMAFYAPRGSVCFVSSSNVVTIEPLDCDTVELWSLMFDYQLCCYLMYTPVPENLQSVAAKSPSVLEPCEATKEIQELFERFYAVNSKRAPSYSLIKISLLGQISLIFQVAANRLSEEFSRRELPLAWRVNRYLDLHSQENITARDVAAVFGTDPNTLNRELRTVLGHDFQYVLNRKRCIHVCAYILCDNLPLDYVALNCGFKTDVTFYRVFKSIMGMTPSEYRAHLLEDHGQMRRGDIIDNRTFQILKYTFENFSEALSLDSISKNVHVTPSVTRALLNKFLGAGYKEVLSLFRVRYSEALLSSTDLSLLEIGVMAGFGSQRSFCRIFSEMNGVSPSEYRQAFYSDKNKLQMENCLPARKRAQVKSAEKKSAKQNVSFGLRDYFNTSVLDDLSFNVRSFGFPMPKTISDGFVMLLVRSGTGRLEVNGRQYDLSAGILALVHPFQSYSICPDAGVTLELCELYCSFPGAVYIMACPYIKTMGLEMPSSASVAALLDDEFSAVKAAFSETRLRSDSSYMMNRMRALYFIEVLGIFCAAYYSRLSQKTSIPNTERPYIGRYMD